MQPDFILEMRKSPVRYYWTFAAVNIMVEAGGVEPPSEGTPTVASTRIVSAFNLAVGSPGNRIPASQPA